MPCQAVILRCEKQARRMFYLFEKKHKHFSFLLRKNNVMSMGWNQPFKTHPIAARYGHRFNSIHSEVHCITNNATLKTPFESNASIYTMLNLRFKMDGSLGLSIPCSSCHDFLSDVGIREVVYSRNDGKFGSILPTI